MGLLSEVILSAEEVEVQKFSKEVPALKSDIYVLKSEVMKCLEKKCLENLAISDKVSHNISRIEYLQKKLDELKFMLQAEEGTFKIFSENIKESNDIMKELKIVCDIQQGITSLKGNYKVKNFSASLKVLSELEILLQQMKNSDEICKYFKQAVVLQEGLLFYHYGKLFNSKYLTSICKQKGTNILKVEKNALVDDLLRAIFQYKRSFKNLEDFVVFLWEFILLPVVTCSTKVIISDQRELKVVMLKTQDKPNYSVIFENLFRVVCFLHCNVDFCIDKTNSISLLEYVGTQIGENLSQLLIDCLRNTSSQSNEDYCQIIQKTKQLQEELNGMKLVKDLALLEYAENLQCTAFDKKCAKLVCNAQLVIDQKNNTIVSVGTPILNINSPHSQNLPLISISSNIQEVLHFIENIFSVEISKTTEENRYKLFSSILKILTYYRYSIQKCIEEISSGEIALFYNNCKYVAHQLREWNICYYNVLGEISFKEESFLFDTIGKEALRSFVNRQYNKLDSILKEFYGTNTNILCDIEDKSEKSIQHVLNVLNSLRNSWFNILSLELFKVTIGLLINLVCQSLVKFIFKFTKLKRPAVDKLSKIFGSVIKFKSVCFMDSCDDYRITNWKKFESVSFILNSNLVEIETNWKCKDGILKSGGLESSEIEFLTRSLFKDS